MQSEIISLSKPQLFEKWRVIVKSLKKDVNYEIVSFDMTVNGCTQRFHGNTVVQSDDTVLLRFDMSLTVWFVSNN